MPGHELCAFRVGSEEEERELELLDVYVADVSPAQAQALSRVLARHVRQPEIAHLKRIRSGRLDAAGVGGASGDFRRARGSTGHDGEAPGATPCLLYTSPSPRD